MVADMVRLAVDPERMGRLLTVLEEELGHELAFAVERGKIAANGGTGAAQIGMGFITPNLSQEITPQSLDSALSDNRALLRDAAAETLRMAGVGPDEIGRIVLVGGSSLMRFVSEEASALCPNVQVLRSEAFTAVVDGLALAARP